MTPQTFKQIRQSAGMTQDQLRKWLRLKDPRIIGRYESGQCQVSGPVSILMEQLAATTISEGNA